jgi:Tol biopolymer transport system component
MLADRTAVEPAWSPDGRRIAYVGMTEGPKQQRRVFVMDADGSAPEAASGGDLFVYGPRWSRDGAELYWSAMRRMGGRLHGSAAILAAPAAGGESRRLTDFQVVDTLPCGMLARTFLRF